MSSTSMGREWIGRLASTLRFITSHPLTRGRPASAVARFVGWQLGSRVRREIDFDWMDGARLNVSRGMTGATGNIYYGLHEFVEMAFLIHLLRPGDTFIDVGANIGSYTILASKVCGARTVAFEPDLDTAARLMRNIALNGLDTKVEVYQVALAAETGEIRFSVGLDTMNHVNPPEGAPVQTVPSRALDEIGGLGEPLLIKLDVEGFEEKVLSGAKRVLASGSLIALQSEAQGPAIDQLLSSFGFVRAYYDPFARTLSDRPVGYATSNAIFVRDRAEVERRLREAPTRRIVGVSI